MPRKVSRETNDPIAAIATAPGRAGIGIVRISGTDIGPTMAGVLGRELSPRVATLCRFRDRNGEVIDSGVALWFPAPASFTGESVLELHGHGGPVVLQSLLRRCIELGCRLARPGEFSERAFINGRLDLAQAEAIADLIEASSEQAARCAAQTLVGEFSRRVNALVQGIVDLRVHIEAAIDFPEEEIDPDDTAKLIARLDRQCEALAELRRTAHQGMVLREGLTVVLIGRPNVGKSSLLNRLAGEDLAIVTEIPGTTRDQVRATIHLEGVPFHLIDTAGLRETDDPVERIGIERTWAAVKTAGAAIVLVEEGELAGKEEARILASLSERVPLAWVTNKIDLYAGTHVSRGTRTHERGVSLRISALTGEGVEELCRWLLAVSGWQVGQEGVFLARQRHLQALEQAEANLRAARAQALRPELFAEELRLAQQALGKITGAFTADDLLGEIFGRFCVGK